MSDRPKQGSSSSVKSGGVERLTPMQGRIHCAATADTQEAENGNELDSIAIKYCLDALAEEALAIARRKKQLES